MERADERKTMVFITHSIDEAIMLGDRIAVMTRGPAASRKCSTCRSAVRATSTRCAPIRALRRCASTSGGSCIRRRPRHAERTQGGRVTTIDETRALSDARARTDRRQGARRARRRRAPDAPRHSQSRDPPGFGRGVPGALGDRRTRHRPGPVHDAERGRGRGGRDDPQRRTVDLSLSEPGGAALSGSRSRSCSGSGSGCCWRATGCSTWRSASTSPSSIRSRRSRWCR